MTPILITGPAAEPVSLAEAKAWLRLDTSDEDDLVGALVTSARLIVEATTRRMLLTQTWRLTLDAWPGGKIVAIPFAPARAIAAIRVRDAAGAAATLDAGSYTLVDTPDHARLVFAAEPPAPGRAAAGVEIDVTLGYGDAARDVPAPLRQAILALVARWFEARGDALADPANQALPAGVAALLAPFRRGRLA